VTGAPAPRPSDRAALRGVSPTVRDAKGRVRHESLTDPLTELPNRTLLEEHLRPALARAVRERSLIAVCYLDLLGFQELNEQLGHAAGAELLTHVARRTISSTVTSWASTSW